MLWWKIWIFRAESFSLPILFSGFPGVLIPPSKLGTGCAGVHGEVGCSGMPSAPWTLHWIGPSSKLRRAFMFRFAGVPGYPLAICYTFLWKSPCLMGKSSN